jgi:hypothetical protein
MRRRSIIIIPADSQTLANRAAQVVDPIGGEFTFNIELIARGQSDDAPATHFICNWLFEDGERELFESAARSRALWARLKIYDLAHPDPADKRNQTKEEIFVQENLKMRENRRGL